MSLADKECQPCRGGVPPLTRAQFEPMLSELSDWTLSPDEKRISKTIKTKDFMASMDLANKIAPLAEAQGHHPDLGVRWGELEIVLWTHAVGGLTEADFILAAKIDRIL